MKVFNTLMKRMFLFILLLFSFSLFSQENNDLFTQELQIDNDYLIELKGIWENPYRILIFDESLNCNIVLKTFYGWYYDPSIKTKTLVLDSVYPLCINDSLYLEYYQVKQVDNGFFYKPCSNITDYLINAIKEKNEIYGYYEKDNEFYRIRYWKVEKDFSDEIARYEDIQVDKMIKIAGASYTCVPGKGTKIRNIETITKPLNMIFTEENEYMSFSKPFAQKSTIQDLEKEIVIHNSQRKPMRKPLIELMDLDFYYDEIERIRNKS